MSERWGDSRADRDALDRHLTDQPEHDDQGDEVEPTRVEMMDEALAASAGAARSLAADVRVSMFMAQDALVRDEVLRRLDALASDADAARRT